MKRFYLLLAAAALLAAAGCQKEPAVAEKGELTKAFIEFNLNFTGEEMTKADYEPDTDPITDGNQAPGTAVGNDNEHEVSSAEFYFFQNGTFIKCIKVLAEKITSGVAEENHVKKTTVPTELETGTYNVYATINLTVECVKGVTKEDDFKTRVIDFTPVAAVPDDGLPMSSRSKEGYMSCEVTITNENTFEHPAKVSLYMERMNAKISMKNNAEKYTVTGIADIALTGYKVVNLTEKTYLFRHVAAVAEDMTMSNQSYGSITETIQVVDPETGLKVAYESNMPGNINFDNYVNTNSAYSAMPAGDGMNTLIYCNENVMAPANQLKTYATAIAFEASITPAADKYFVLQTDEVVPGTYASGDLWYFDGKFYDSLKTLNAANDFSLTTANYSNFGVKKFVGGVCYYTYYIKHYDNFKPLELGFMEYAIVRNNDYQVTITGIKDLGEDVPTVEPDPIEMEESYFQATLFVRPWTVRAQDAVLG